jgi:molybdopterin synthase sulfur carrier subunit
MRDQAHVTVRLVYLARLREAFGTSAESYALAAQRPATVGGLIDALRARGGAFATELAAGRAFRVAVNHAMASASDPLRDGDEVALFPPVTGG